MAPHPQDEARPRRQVDGALVIASTRLAVSARLHPYNHDRKNFMSGTMHSEIRTSIAVDGMTCGICVHAVERALTGVPGVERAVVDLARGLAVVEGAAPPENLVAAVRAAGYSARLPAKGEAEGQTAPEGREKHRSGCC